ncbi:MAG: cation transporting ATPase C-terminal domain-containing protein [Pseudomonadota bacterium]
MSESSKQQWQAFAFSPKVLFSNRWGWGMTGIVIIIQLAWTYWSPLQTAFGTAGLSMEQWALILGVCAVLSVLVEIEKLITRVFNLNWASPGMQAKVTS